MTAAWRIALLDETEPEYPPDAVRYDLLRAGRTTHRASAGWLARDGERPIALCTVVLDHRASNEHAASMPELWVLPSDRRRGVGSRLLSEAIAFARSGGRSHLTGNHYEGATASIAFAAHHGATPASAIGQDRALVANLDAALMTTWNAAPSGYSLVTSDDVCPDDLIDRFVNVSWAVCERHDASGDPAGRTELTLTTYQPWLVRQGTTVVDPRHRGHGIGRWLRSVNALRLLDDRPETRVIETWNDGTNASMLAIDREMGFRPVATWRDVELRIDR